MQNYRIGVLLSAYNGEKYIAQQIESIMKQSIVKHITLLVRNDGSTDNTDLILKKLEAKYPNMIVINGTNIGLIASFFKLLDIAVKEYNFDYYSFSDQDDYWMKDKLEKSVKFLFNEKQKDIPLLYGCRSFIVNDDLKKTGFITQAKERKITFYNTAIQNIVIGHNQVLNKELAEVLIKNNKELTKVYSQDLWITNVAAVSGKIIFDNTPHTLYRMHGHNELGYGKGKLDRLRGHLIRLKKKEPKKMTMQLMHFVKCYNKYLSPDEKDEVRHFIEMQKNVHSRIKYARKTKLYRQTTNETRSFKLLYVVGNYNV